MSALGRLASARQDSVARSLTGVTVRDAMCPGVLTCAPDAPLSAIAAIMTTHGVHSVAINPPHPETLRIVTDLELVRAALKGPDDTLAADIAAEPPVVVSTDAALEDAVAIMASSHVSHLLATDPSTGAPAGVVSSFDVAAIVAGWEPRLARILRPDPAMRPSAATLREAKIRDVIHRRLACCAPDATLSMVARRMAQHRVHCVVITAGDATGDSHAHAPWGLIEDLDLIVAMQRDALASPAATLKLTSSLALPERASLQDAAELMVEHDKRHTVAVGSDGVPSGMVSTLDIAWILAWKGA